MADNAKLIDTKALSHYNDKVSDLLDKKANASHTHTTVNGHTVNSDVPANAKFTDTTYPDMTGASASAVGKHGLVPAPAAGKQNLFLRGDGTWATPSDTKYTLPKASSSALGGVITGATVDSTDGLTPVHIDANGKIYYKDTNTQYNDATESARGIMTAADKKKLDGIESGANKTTVDASFSSDSTNPVQNKVITAALNARALVKELSNENLNDIVKPGFYNAGGTNTVTNKPSGVAHFGLEVIWRASGNYYTQILYTDTTTYRRNCIGGTWHDWTVDHLTDTTYQDMTAATTSTAGKHGLVPAPAAGKQNSFLRGDGTWVVPTDTKYTHPNSGVTAGTYRSVTVNAAGHVTAGTNPTTLAGYGITDAAAKSHTHESADIKSLDASKITSGTIDIARLPAAALERCVPVKDDTARFALTTASVQLGDTVKVTSTGLMYLVVDTSKLNSEAGYEVYTAGSASSVPWSGVTDKPTSFTPASHTHDDRYYTETEMDTKLAGKANSSHTHTKSQITDFPTKLSEFTNDAGFKTTDNNTTYSMAVAANSAANGAAKIRLTGSDKTTKDVLIKGTGATTVTTDASGNIVVSSSDTKYTLPTAGSTLGGVKTTSTVTSNSGYTAAPIIDGVVYYKDTNNTYSDMTAATADAAGKHGLVPAPAAGKQGSFLRGDGTWATPTNTQYNDATESAHGLMTAADKKKLNGIAAGATANTGTITGIKMNGASKGTSGVVDLGTVLTGGSQTSTSSADGGSNVYTFSDGSTITVKNGTKGSTGAAGTSAAWFTGTAVTGTSTSATAFTVTGSKAGDMYLNTSTMNVYRASAANSWVYVCNIKGATGVTGTAATIEVGTVTTGAAGSSATVTNVGTTSAAKFNFTIPKGAAGTNGTSAAWFTGTVVTGTATSAVTFSVSGSKAGDMYLNTSTMNVYKATGANTWVYACNIKGATGAKGDKGATGDTGPDGKAATIEVGTVTTGAAGTNAAVTNAGTTSAAKFNFTIPRGANGTNGTSAAWFTGTAVTGTSTSAITFSVSGSKTGDMYLNTSTYNVYRASAANSWIYVCNIKGATGAKGDKGATGETGPQGETGATGTAATIEVGTVTTGAAGTNAAVTNAGTASAAKFNFTIPKGATGAAGTSAAWFTGTTVTGTATSATAFTVSGSKAGDMYLNTSTYNVYRASAANSWIYVCNIKGATGSTGATPDIAVAAGTNIDAVGTPTVTAAKSGNTTTFTFDYLKGAKGDKGDKGENATTTAVATTSANGLMSKDDKSKLDGITTMTAASSSAAGKGGLVPAPTKGAQEKFLRGDGTWAVPTVITSKSVTYSYGTNRNTIWATLPVESLVSGNLIQLNCSSVSFWDNDSDGNRILTDNDEDTIGIYIKNDQGKYIISNAPIYAMNGYMSDSDDTSNATFRLRDLTRFSYSTMLLLYTASGKLVCLNYTATDMFGATDARNGRLGLVPKPYIGDQEKFLRGDGTWATPTDTKYALPTASSSTLGGVKTTSTVTNVTGWTAAPIVDGVPYFYDHTYSIMTAATASAAGKYGLVPSPAAGKQNCFLRGDGTWAEPSSVSGSYLPLSGGTVTGAVTFTGATANIYKNLDGATYRFPLNGQNTDGSTFFRIATQHDTTNNINRLLFQVFPSDNTTSNYAQMALGITKNSDGTYASSLSTNFNMAGAKHVFGIVGYTNVAVSVTLGFKPKMVLVSFHDALVAANQKKATDRVYVLGVGQHTDTGFTIPASLLNGTGVSVGADYMAFY